MRTTITVSTWGGRGAGRGIPRVRVSEERSALEAALARIERETALRACSVSPQGISLENGQPESRHYEVTLGYALPRRTGGGFSVEGSVWIAVPASTPVDHGQIGYRG